eukprot:jgi/Botrbrau1/16500/Bobra.0142s0094.1
MQKMRAHMAELESERTDMQSVTTSALRGIQERMNALASQVELRDAEVMQLRDERDTLDRGFNDMKQLLQQSMEERGRLSAKLKAAETAVQEKTEQLELHGKRAEDLRLDLAQARAEGEAAVRERSALGQAQKEALEARIAALETEKEEEQRARANAEHRLAAVEEAKEASDRARATAERERREVEAQALAAAEIAEAERTQRAEAQGLTEQLRAEGERRARVFNNAVKAAVAKIQNELESERDSLEQRLREVEKQLSEAMAEKNAALAAAREAHREVEMRTADAEAAGNLAVAAEEAADAARARERTAREAAALAETTRLEAVKAAEEAEGELAGALSRAQEAEAALKQSTVDKADAQARLEMVSSELGAEVALWRSRAEAATEAAKLAEARAESATASFQSAGASASFQTQAARDQIEAMEQELSELRAAARAGWAPANSAVPSFKLGDVLNSLGLDKWKEERLRAAAGDLESGASKKTDDGPDVSSKPAARPGPGRFASTWVTGAPSMGTRGAISLRIWLLIAYLVVLHISLMLAFTAHNDARALCEGKDKILPGM